MAWREPLLFVDCHGAEELAAAGVTVLEIPELAERAREPNAHLLPAPPRLTGSRGYRSGRGCSPSRGRPERPEHGGPVPGFPGGPRYP